VSFGDIFPSTVPTGYYLVFAALLFTIGLFGLISRRNAIGMLLSIELMMNAVNVNLAAFSRSGLAEGQVQGQLMVVFTITVAVAEAAIGLAIIVAMFKLRRTVNADELNLLRG
jgi:NADH-quinone oxidoreductase subunit K